MSSFVIAVYKPKPGMEQRLAAVISKHVPTLRAEQLITDRPAHVMRAKDGTMIEVFEWKSAEAIDQAHDNPRVKVLWDEFHATCDYIPIAAVPESQQIFSGFQPVDG